MGIGLDGMNHSFSIEIDGNLVFPINDFSLSSTGFKNKIKGKLYRLLCKEEKEICTYKYVVLHSPRRNKFEIHMSLTSLQNI